jgi:hypothetical protein
MLNVCQTIPKIYVEGTKYCLILLKSFIYNLILTLKNLTLSLNFLQGQKIKNELKFKFHIKDQKEFCKINSFLLQKSFNLSKKNFNLNKMEIFFTINSTLKLKKYYKKYETFSFFKKILPKKINCYKEKNDLFLKNDKNLNLKVSFQLERNDKPTVNIKSQICKFQKFDKMIDYINLNKENFVFLNENLPLPKILSNKINIF